MKGRNWRDFEPPEKRRRKPRRYEEPPRRYEDVYQPPKRKKRRRKGGIFRRLLVVLILFVLGYGGFFLYYRYGKPYTVALDAGHGGEDVGSVGVIQEVQLTEQTVTALEKLLKEDGRFRVVLTRKMGEGMPITDRNRKLAFLQPDLILSVHGNADETGEASGFECYPAVPGMENHEASMEFAALLAEEMEAAGSELRGGNGIRFGYYVNGQKMLVDSTDTTVYDYDTFGVLKNQEGAAVLVEQCFVTNERDVAQFGTEEGCQKAAEAYYRAILRYLGAEETTENQSEP